MNDMHDGDTITTDEQMEQLTIPNGFRLEEEHIAIEIVYDGEDVIFRSEDGELLTMDTLCYLDHVVGVCVRDILDDESNPSDASAAQLGHILGSMIQHLHTQMHIIAMRKRMQGSGLAGLLGALAGARMGEEPDGGPVGAFVLGPNGLQQLEPGELDTLLGGEGGGGLVLEGEADHIQEDESAQPDDAVEEIIIGDLPKNRR